jgi:glycopeptide antibiotics resistance protein
MTRQGFYSAILVAYALALAYITLWPTAAVGESSFRWVPLVEIWRIVTNAGGAYADIGQVAGNIALFVPLGWLLPMVSRRLRRPLRPVVVGAACSALIELSQLLVVTGRSPASDDVLLNTAGALVGSIMFFAPRRV